MSQGKAASARRTAPAIEDQLAALTAEVSRLTEQVNNMYKNGRISERILGAAYNDGYDVGFQAGRASRQPPRNARPGTRRGYLMPVPASGA
jgi:hypothetical protein